MPDAHRSLEQFVWQHRDHDPHGLALLRDKFPDISMSEAAQWVSSLQKIKNKIPDWYQPGMQFPSSVAVEQCSSWQTAQYKAGLFQGEQMTDLTGGLGVDVFYWSRQFRQVTYVEQNPALHAAAAHNFQQLNMHNVNFVLSESSAFLENLAQPQDLIYLDPARRDNAGGRVMRLEDCSPDVLALKERLLKKANHVLLKTAPLLDIQMAIRQLACVKKVWVVALENECKEVLYWLEASEQNSPSDAIPIVATQLDKNGTPDEFHFNLTEERAASVEYSAPLRFLYEPHAGILKAGAFKIYACRFGLNKLHANTHLYTSADQVENVPGRGFQIEQVLKYDRKAVQNALPDLRANIAVRNFPDTPEAVRQRLGLRDGGDVYLFATTHHPQQKVILLCRKF